MFAFLVLWRRVTQCVQQMRFNNIKDDSSTKVTEKGPNTLKIDLCFGYI